MTDFDQEPAFSICSVTNKHATTVSHVHDIWHDVTEQQGSRRRLRAPQAVGARVYLVGWWH